MPERFSVFILGDIIGQPGRRVVKRYLSRLSPKPNLIVANVENIAHGFGVTEKSLSELREVGVRAFTGGNHMFDRKEIFDFIDREPYLLRPANYPEGTPGRGWCTVECDGVKVGILNLQGRVFMEPLRSPFLIADALIPQVAEQTNLIIVDMHAEATAEKVALGWYLDGRVSSVIGSHTHVPTADERILPGGTAYLTDMGACGPADGVIGMDRPSVFRRFIDQLPSRFEIAPGPASLNGVMLTLDVASGKAISIARVHYREESDNENSN